MFFYLQNPSKMCYNTTYKAIVHLQNIGGNVS